MDKQRRIYLCIHIQHKGAYVRKDKLWKYKKNIKTKIKLKTSTSTTTHSQLELVYLHIKKTTQRNIEN